MVISSLPYLKQLVSGGFGMLLSVSHGLSFASTKDILGLATTILFGLVSFWVAAAVTTRRQIVYWIESCVRGEGNESGDRLEIGLAGRGRQDITAEHFHKDKPLLLNVGCTIMEGPTV